jgi:hypothetical protein
VHDDFPPKKIRYQRLGADNGYLVLRGFLLKPLPPLGPGVNKDTEYENNEIKVYKSDDTVQHVFKQPTVSKKIYF